MKATEIRELTVKEIEERIETFEAQLQKLRMNHAVSPLDNPMKINEMRKTIARMKTILTERTSQKQ
ncbi:MAG: 50S ribosomal protein L29 [Tenuifilaceae bacterium]|jgi:large subunit ribosomal protein L29|uniref:50S ribosomal protein L29 n=1 Tax=Perlabentimonas gracilis TaxID=2715279 RepID=UPI00140AD434|nr:50S ribosomal protein L29 [Perlabentimonas gracilis]MDX9769189.1 50S ribosomal protein L29 [Tenuifilaceae bacterium]MDY0252917.1 50S ribosomal protein L29 [Tenuifilaceae bacterium]NHB68308.1 50S ribosomal protein L29 [Perlabentimonas gracilis]